MGGRPSCRSLYRALEVKELSSASISTLRFNFTEFCILYFSLGKMKLWDPEMSSTVFRSLLWLSNSPELRRHYRLCKDSGPEHLRVEPTARNTDVLGFPSTCMFWFFFFRSSSDRSSGSCLWIWSLVIDSWRYRRNSLEPWNLGTLEPWKHTWSRDPKAEQNNILHFWLTM